MSIISDTTERNDFRLTNISGYDNTAEAFKNVPGNRDGDKIIIPETTVLVGNSDSMIITGEGIISQDGSIMLDIETSTSTLDNNFTVYLNSTSHNYYKSYEGDGQSLTILSNQLTLKFTIPSGPVLEFSITDSINEECSLIIERQSLIAEGSTDGYLIEAAIYFAGSSAFGTINYSAGSWQNAHSVELNLQ